MSSVDRKLQITLSAPLRLAAAATERDGRCTKAKEQTSCPGAALAPPPLAGQPRPLWRSLTPLASPAAQAVLLGAERGLERPPERSPPAEARALALPEDLVELEEAVLLALARALETPDPPPLERWLSDAREEARRAGPDPSAHARVNALRDLEEVVRLSRPVAAGWTTREPGFDGLSSLLTGDLVLVRGQTRVPVLGEASEISAGGAASAYSHLMVAVRDPSSGQVQLAESREPHGLRILAAEESIPLHHARTLVLRLSDPEERAQVALHVAEALRELRQQMPIPYNSRLDDEDPRRLNCGQLARRLLGPAFPAAKTALAAGVAEYAARAGMPRSTMILPGDFERDPRFSRVAEAMSPELLLSVRPREAAVLALFDQKNAGAPVLEPRAVSRLLSTTVAWFQDRGLVRPFNPSVIGAAMDLRHDVATKVSLLAEQQRWSMALRGRPPTRSEMAAHLAKHGR